MNLGHLDVLLITCGDDPTRAMLRDLAKSLGARVSEHRVEFVAAAPAELPTCDGPDMLPIEDA